MKNKVLIFCNGLLIENFIDFSLDKSIENFCNSFSFTTTQQMLSDKSIKQGSKIKIEIADELVFTGNVGLIQNNQELNSHSITVSGRDKTGELINSSILPKQYKQNDFKKLLRIILDDNGYSNIKINSDIAILPKLPSKSFVCDKQQKIFDFIDDLARMIRVILITDENGDILITREGADLAVGSLDLTSSSANIMSSGLSVDNNDTYKFIQLIGSLKTNSSKKRFNQKVEFTDTKATTNKRLIVNINMNTNKQNLSSIANWYMAVKRGKGASYSCSVQGFYTNVSSGLLWQANTILSLKDEANELNSFFLIQGVSYKQDNSGSKTELSICNIGSFTEFDNNPFLSTSVSKLFSLFAGDLTEKYR